MVVELFYYALSSGSLPPITRTLEVGELARRAVLAQFGGQGKLPAPIVLSGHGGDGPALSQHQHAHYLPVDANADGLIDHLAIYSPVGFEPEAIEALQSLQRLYAGAEIPGWSLRLEAMGPAAALQGTGGLWAAAVTWTSVTPLILPRYPKQHRDGTPKLTERGEQRDGPEDQVRREWALRQREIPLLPDLLAVERLPVYLIRGRELPWRMFQVSRRSGSGRSSGFVYGVVLHFAAPVVGPVGLGYGCHFGLGQYRWVEGV